jgi:AmiR/NasT family two-component response regulator
VPTDQATRHKLKTAGVDCFIEKPFVPRVLLEVLWVIYEIGKLTKRVRRDAYAAEMKRV